MFFGKKETGFGQTPAVNMVEQPGIMPGVPTPGASYDAYGYAQPGVPTPGMPMEGPGAEHYMHDGMMHHQPQMGYVCEPCEVIPPQPQIYVVQKGDTVYKIAQRYGLDWRELAGYNRLGNPDLIYPGERLFIPPRY